MSVFVFESGEWEGERRGGVELMNIIVVAPYLFVIYFLFEIKVTIVMTVGVFVT